MEIKLVHILTEIDTGREINSIASLSPMSNYGINYIQQINQRYTGNAWIDPPAISKTPYTNHGSGHYGAFQSFKKAILDNFTEETEALVICECDCILETDIDNFSKIIREAVDLCNRESVDFVSFGSRYINGFLQSPIIEEDKERFGNFYITNKTILAHCIMIPKRSREFILGQFNSISWDSPDIWFNEAFWMGNRNRFAILWERAARQHEGVSLIDNIWKESQ